MEQLRLLLHNETFQIVMAGIIPAILLIAYICWKDRKQPEPFIWIFNAIMSGCLSAVLAILMALYIETLPFWDYIPINSTSRAWATAFLSAAIPEETAKWWFLYRLSRKNPYFDEYMDAIVYAVCIGMGFAGLENVMYLFSAHESWHSLALIRCMLSVPAHFAFAVLMGYYFGKIHFTRSKWKKTYLAPMVLVAPIMAHGIFDGLLMMNQDMSAPVSATIAVVFLVFVVRLHRFSFSRIHRFHNR